MKTTFFQTLQYVAVLAAAILGSALWTQSSWAALAESQSLYLSLLGPPAAKSRPLATWPEPPPWIRPNHPGIHSSLGPNASLNLALNRETHLVRETREIEEHWDGRALLIFNF